MGNLLANDVMTYRQWKELSTMNEWTSNIRDIVKILKLKVDINYSYS